MHNKIRVFFALSPSLLFKQCLQQQLSALQQQYKDQVRWGIAGNYHVTVKYLGVVPAKSISETLDLVAKEVATCASPKIECQKIMPFPNHEKPRVIASLIKPQMELQQLFNVVEDTLSNNGYKQEQRAYLPHMTVARVRNFNCPKFKPIIVENCSETVNQLTLLQSISTKQGTLYIPLAQLPLQSPTSSATLYPSIKKS